MLKKLLSLGLLWAATVSVQAEDVFDVEVFDLAAEQAAVSQVITRLTGRTPEQVEGDFDRYLSAPDEWVTSSQTGDFSTRVRVSSALAADLRAASVPVWQAPRPDQWLWVVVDDGAGRRALDGRGTDRMTVALRRASEYWAIPLAYPFWDDEDRAALTLSELWGLFLDAVPRASERYGGSFVAGRIRLTGVSWQVNLQDEQGRRLQAEFADESDLAEGLLAWLAAPLVEDFGLTGEQRVVLQTSFVDGADYSQWIAQVRRLAAVDRIFPTAMSSRLTTLEIESGLAAPQLLRLLQAERLLLDGTLEGDQIVGVRQ